MLEIFGHNISLGDIRNLLFIALIVLGALLFAINYRFPQLLIIIRTILAAILFKKKIDDETLDEIIDTAGYSYDANQDIFYSKLYPWQRNLGYCRLYDEAAIVSGMIIDCEPVYFVYGGKKWLIEFWKGQYGMTTGCELGVYYTDDFDLDVPEIFTGTFYNAVADEDMLYMSCSLMKHGKTLFTREGKHWWLTGFILGEFSEPHELVMDISISFKDRVMRNAFIKGLQRAGYSYRDYYANGNTIRFTFDQPRTPQPIARTPATDWVTQRKNELLCKKYREITDSYDNLTDKINAIIEYEPGALKELFNIGKGKPSFREYRKIRRHTKKPYKRPYMRRVSRVYESATEIPFDNSSRFFLMSDVHRGDGSWADDFSRNRNLFIAALNYYYRQNYTYIEIGDGDELWENKKYSEIINIHRDIFQLLAMFHKENRLYLIFGHHDMEKKQRNCIKSNLYEYFDERENKLVPLFENINCYEGLILKHRVTGDEIFLTHGHQVDFLNYTAWKAARFLVRYLWRPLNVFGIKDPTSTAKNYSKKERVEKRLTKWVKAEKHMLISGHTHRPMMPKPGEPPYFNGGSCVYPQDITGIEIADGSITLVRWNTTTTVSGLLAVQRQVMVGPIPLRAYWELTRTKGRT
jgi:UDP-2,3-diacylglucosamine pyrophosphatase LpxH